MVDLGLQAGASVSGHGQHLQLGVFPEPLATRVTAIYGLLSPGGQGPWRALSTGGHAQPALSILDLGHWDGSGSLNPIQPLFCCLRILMTVTQGSNIKGNKYRWFVLGSFLESLAPSFSTHQF